MQVIVKWKEKVELFSQDFLDFTEFPPFVCLSTIISFSFSAKKTQNFQKHVTATTIWDWVLKLC